MEKRIMITSVVVLTLLVGIFCFYNLANEKEAKPQVLNAVVLSETKEMLMLQDKDQVIYAIENCDKSLKPGDTVLLEYTGILNKNMAIQDISVTNCNAIYTMNEEDFVLTTLEDEGIFSQYYGLASKMVKNLSLDEKIAQVLLIRYPGSNAVNILKKYPFGGYVFFEKNFTGKTKSEVKSMMKELQDVSKIPILTAVDEEGGKVVRISSNSNLAEERFLSPSELYRTGGMNLIKSDTIIKSALLKELGLNLNLAPVVDVVTDPNAYMYERTIGEGTGITATYAKTVIEASYGSGVSYTLKHFPGYGNNTDTHIGSATDNRSYDDILNNDIPPFEAGIDAGAEAVLISHNVVTSMDQDNPASLSPSVHNLLRNSLGFTGIVISDDLSMGALDGISDPSVKGILAGNDLIISTNYEEDMSSIKSAIIDGDLAEELIDKLATRVIAWKYYKGLIVPNQK